MAEVVRLSPVATVLTDPNLADNPIVYANAAFARMTGYPPDQTIGRNCRFLQGEGSDPGVIRDIAATLARHGDGEFELLNYRQDGTPFWNRLTVGPIHDETGALRYYFGTQRDVTHRVEADRTQGETTDRLGTALDAVRAIGVFDWDVAADNLAVNATFAQAFGLDPAVAAGGLPIAAFLDHIDPASRPGLEAAMARAIETGELFEHEYGVEGTDRHRWLMGRGRCRHDVHGRPTRFSGVVIDITRRKEAEDALRAALDRSEVAQREVDHRIKNLFALIPAIVNLSARRAPSTEDFARRVEERIAALARAHSLTLGAYSQANGVDLARLLHAVFEPFTDHAEPFVLNGPDIRLTSGEAGGLALIFYELATNSAKHGALSAPDGTIAIDWTKGPMDGAASAGPRHALTVRWHERGGPPIAGPPDRSGAGTHLVDRLAIGFGGRATRTWATDGLSLVLGIPLEKG